VKEGLVNCVREKAVIVDTMIQTGGSMAGDTEMRIGGGEDGMTEPKEIMTVSGSGNISK
jgi:hypothetical protein